MIEYDETQRTNGRWRVRYPALQRVQETSEDCRSGRMSDVKRHQNLLEIDREADRLRAINASLLRQQQDLGREVIRLGDQIAKNGEKIELLDARKDRILADMRQDNHIGMAAHEDAQQTLCAIQDGRVGLHEGLGEYAPGVSAAPSTVPDRRTGDVVRGCGHATRNQPCSEGPARGEGH